ncbi:MAG TPA: hypothetical protein VF765_10165 [Polyangiaceae bacterium]
MKNMRWGAMVLAAGLLSALAGCGSSGSGNPAAPSDGGTDGAGPDGGPTDSGMHEAGSDAGEAGTATLSLPQFVHGAARVDTTAFAKIPLVVAVSGAQPSSVTITVDTAPAVTAAAVDATHYAATLDTSSLSTGKHTITAKALAASGATIGTVSGSLSADTGSLQFTQFAQVGPAYASRIQTAPSGDRLAFTWISVPGGGSHRYSLNYLDGAGARLSPTDIMLSDPADDAVQGATSFSSDAIGVVYNVPQTTGTHWLVKMRIVGADGSVKVPTMDLTQGEGAFSLSIAGVDPGGFSAAWLHIRPTDDAGMTQPVQLRFARWDVAAAKLQGPLVIDSDQPQPSGSTQGPQQLEPLAELGIACNQTVCLVLYSRDEYNAVVQLNVPKLFLATVDLAGGQLAGTPVAVEDSDWDTQEFGQQIVALADGSFVLVYTANDTATAVNPMTPCDMTLERDLLFAEKIDATGKLAGAPKPIFDFQGSREYPRIAAHPAGWALFWEDQRSECDATGGHIGMAMNVAAPDLASLLDPYLEAPGSIALPPEYPSLAVTGSNFVVAWSDNRHGNGLAMPANELYLDTYWR